MTIQKRLRIIALESKYEVFKLFRTTAFIVPTITFPLIFYIFFGVAFGANKAVGPNATMGVYLIASYGAFGVIGAALSAFGAGIALERGQGWLQLKHATPMPLYAYFIAKLFASAIFGALIALALFTLGATLGGARLDAPTWIALFFTLVAGSIPFALLGVTIGYLAPAQSAVAVLNLIYLPMGFMSGLWIPVKFLPKTVQAIAEWLPAFHLGQLALGVLNASAPGKSSSHLLALGGFTLLFLVTATVAYRFDRSRNYA
jgi:ABC-2 type transport system permease protein